MTSYFYMSESYWDAVQFKPKIDIYFLGFTLLNNYEKIPWTLIFKYFIGDVGSQEYTFEMT